MKRLNILTLISKSALIMAVSLGLTLRPVLVYAQTSSMSGIEFNEEDGVNEAKGMFKGQDVKDDYLSLLAMIGMGFLAMGFVAYKNSKGGWPLDMMIAMGAGAAFIGGEITSMVAYKDDVDQQLDYTLRDDGSIDDTQLESFQKQKQAFKDVKKAAQVKMGLQFAAAAGFGGAAIAAMLSKVKEEAADKGCDAGLMSAKAAAISNCITMNPQCVACDAALTKVQAEWTALTLGEEAPGPSQVKKALANKTIQEARAEMYGVCTPIAGVVPILMNTCEPAFNIKEMTTAGGNTVAFSSHQRQAPNWKEQILSIFFAKAYASKKLSMFGLGAFGLGLLGGYIFKSSEVIDNFMAKNHHRAIVYGLIASVATGAALASKNNASRMDENIAEIDKIIDKMTRLKNGTVVNGGTPATVTIPSTLGIPPNGNEAIQVIQDGQTAKLPCAVQAANGSCGSLGEAITKHTDFSELGSFATVASQTGSLADGLSGKSTISGGTLDTAGSLAGKQSKVARQVAQNQRKLNQLLAESGKKPIDFKGIEKKLFGAYKAKLKKQLRHRGVAPESLLAKLHGGQAPDPSIVADSLSKGDLQADQKVAHNVVPKTGGKSALDSFRFRPTKKTMGAGISSLDDEEYNANQVALSELEADPTELNDIIDDKDLSIFKVITVRYMKSGYPRLLDEKE